MQLNAQILSAHWQFLTNEHICASQTLQNTDHNRLSGKYNIALEYQTRSSCGSKSKI